METKKKIKPTDLKMLVGHKITVDKSADFRRVIELSKQSTASYFTVIENDLPVGLVARTNEDFHSEPTGLFSKFNKTAHVYAPIAEVMLDAPLIIEHGTEVDVLFESFFDRTDARLNEDVILTHVGGTYFGNINYSAIMRLLHGFLNKHMRELRVQKETLAFEHSQVVKVQRDLELTNAELEKSRNQALQGVRMKDMFLANMSHEIRTPMNGVFGMIDLLYDTDLDNDQTQLVTTARNCAEILMQIINDILDFSKIEAGKVAVEIMPFNIVEIIESSISLYSESATSKGIELEVTFDDAPAWVEGDPHRFQQVLNNLISNAVKFTDCGKVEVYLTGVETAAGAGVLTEVRDSGIGISPEKITELFQPFTQADDSHARKYGGTGLGLSICKNLCELLDGTLECDSEPGKGTVFSVILPFAHYTDAEKGACAQSVSQRMVCNAKSTVLRNDFNGMRVLLVEDNLVNQELARRILLKLNCDVSIAEDGRSGLEFLANGRFDCVLMDCQMPVMDGYEATEEIRKGSAGSNCHDIFIAAMTAHAMSGDREKCIQAGMDYYFSKPFGVIDLQKALDQAVQKKESALDPAQQPPEQAMNQ